MTWLARLLLALALFVTAGEGARAVTPGEVLKDPVLEARARALSEELRCMVCQNQSIDDSDAPLAHDIRVLLRERLAAGDSDSQVLDFLVARYGEFILLKPRFNWHTAFLWGAAPGTPEGAVLDALATLVQAYEDRRWPPEALDPIEAIQASMQWNGRTQADLAELLGSRSRASEILNRKRGLTVEMIHKLQSEWGIPAELLIRPYRLDAA